MGAIVDISHHQEPSRIDYDKFAKQLDLAIIRTQYGSLSIDRAYKTHHNELKKRNVPRNAYAWVRGISNRDMEVEAHDFYNRTKEFNPVVWWLDVEEKSMSNMREGVKAYANKLRDLGIQKLGVYIAHHKYKSFNLDLNDFDVVWIPRYGKNTGKPEIKPDFQCDLWQYTSKGRLDGYAGNLDLNMIISDKPLKFFTKHDHKDKKSIIHEIQSTLNSRYGFHIAVDGIYGPETKSALIKGLQIELNRQFDRRLIVDGIFGPKTKESCVNVRKGARGNITWIIQAVLYCLGYDPCGLDGIFGVNTAKAVLVFQKANGLAQDAIVGKNTFSKLFA